MQGRKIRYVILLALIVVLVGTAATTSATAYHQSAVWIMYKFRYEGELDPSDLLVKTVHVHVSRERMPGSQSPWVYGPIYADPFDFDEEPVVGYSLAVDDILDYRIRLSPFLIFSSEQTAHIERRVCDIEIQAQAHFDGRKAEWRDPRWRLDSAVWDPDSVNCRVALTEHPDPNLLTVTIIVTD